MAADPKQRPVIALVTGGATGIGAACCTELARAGFTVAIHHHSHGCEGKLLAESLPGAILVNADLADPSAIDRMCETLRALGTVGALVNNAGVTVDAPLFTASRRDLDHVLAVNLHAGWHLIKKLSKDMIRARHGRIVNISSVVASLGNAGQSAYGMSKAALDNLTRTASLELAPYGVLVNSVAPGFIRTAMTDQVPSEHQESILAKIPLQRAGEPQEVARLVRFLVVEASYCTGAVFHVNGGMYG